MARKSEWVVVTHHPLNSVFLFGILILVGYAYA
jgi:hypothetical protein